MPQNQNLNKRNQIPPSQNIWSLQLPIDPQVLAQIQNGDTVYLQLVAPNGNATAPRLLSSNDIMNLLAPPPPPNAGP